jgi:Holliday junction resolvase-like predicted endonuclease
MHFGRFINSQVFGNAQESKAALYLSSQGLKLLCRNYRSRHGEIDLIMSDSNTLVFVEVRCRFDLIGLAHATTTAANAAELRFDWIKNAFY